MSIPIEVPLFVFLIASALVVANLRDLFAAAMLTGIFSLVSASLFTIMDAVDVAFTEAAVGAGVSVVFFLCTLSLTSKTEYSKPRKILPLLVVLFTGGALFYGTLDMPHFGDRSSPVHTHLTAKFIEHEEAAFHAHHAHAHGDDAHGEHGHADKGAHGGESNEYSKKQGHVDDRHADGGGHDAVEHKAVGLQNIVTSILGSYRSYDTFGETTVIFTAVIGVVLLLRTRPRQSVVAPLRDSAEEEGE